MNPLVEIGDRQTQEWLSEVAMRMQIDDPLRDWMREQARRIDLQSSVDQLIEYLRSDAHEIDRTWIVRQAVRHGVAHAVIADAVVHFLDHNLEIVPEHVSASLLQSCEDLGIFAESGSGLPTRVRTAREKFTRFREDSKFLPWATAPAEARAEFYRPKQNQTNKPAKPDTDNEGDDK